MKLAWLAISHIAHFYFGSRVPLFRDSNNKPFTIFEFPKYTTHPVINWVGDPSALARTDAVLTTYTNCCTVKI